MDGTFHQVHTHLYVDARGRLAESGCSFVGDIQLDVLCDDAFELGLRCSGRIGKSSAKDFTSWVCSVHDCPFHVEIMFTLFRILEMSFTRK